MPNAQRMPTPQSPADFVTRLKALFGTENAAAMENDSEYKYVIYARKSTDTAEKQERSIGDQVVECKTTADRAGLRIVKTLHEERSAKTSDNRPIFREMVDKIIAGEFDSIITWAPDRLARNMKEAGEIIDLLDRGDIKDIRFANGYYFKNDAAGKMMLGMAFVQAKQFSDQHSQNVKRGLNRITAEGKLYDRAKHGYYKDANKYPRPDGENWDLIKRVFEMRLSREEKHSLKEIAEWLEGQGYPRRTKHTNRKPLVINDKFLSDLLRDPFYAGAMVFGGQVINLFEKFDFVPMITPDEFDTLTKENGVNKKFALAEIIKPKGSVKADLLRGMVTCAGCNRAMSTGITAKKLPEGIKRHYFYYRCDTVGCRHKGSSVRAKTILEAVYAFLDMHPMNIERGYTSYKNEMARLHKKHDEELLAKHKALTQRHRTAKGKLDEYKEMLRQNTNDKVLFDAFRDDIKKQTSIIKKLEHEIGTVDEERKLGVTSMASLENFIELFKNLCENIRKIESMDDLDYVLKKLFSNFIVDGKKVTQITQNSPFRELCWSPNSENSVMVAPKRLGMNFLEATRSAQGEMDRWSEEIQRFLKKEPTQKSLAVTY